MEVTVSPKKIALIGGMGFIGSWVFKEMAGKHDFVVISKTNRLNLSNDKFRHSGNSTDSFLENLKDIDAVVHLAAVRPEGGQEKPSFDRYLSNIEISASIFQACRQLGITNIVNISSMSVYSQQNEIPFRETQNALPKNLYGVAKKNVEDIAAFYNHFHGLKIKSLRLAQVIGIGEKEQFMFTTFLKKAISGNTLQLWGRGVGKREYVYVKDVVKAIMRCLELPDIHGVFNIGTGVSTSHKKLAETINQIIGNEDNIELLTDKSTDNSVSVMAIDKARNVLNWQPEWNLKTALMDIKKFF